MSIRNLFDYTQPLTSAATILAAAFVLVSAFAGYMAYQIRNAGDTVSVTGSAREFVRSDFAKLAVTLETHVGAGEEQKGFDRLDTASKRIAASLKKEGFDDIEVPTGYANPQYVYPDKSAPVMVGYSVSRQIVVRSTDIEKMQSLANTVTAFSGAGYTVMLNGLELTYRALDTMRIELLSRAIRDARARADAIAKESGRSVGTLKSSASGVVQVLPRGGVDVSDYGTYDTQSLEKEVMVTVRATFSLE